MNLQTPIKDAGRVYKMYASRLEKLGIFKLEDFLYHIPSRYEDYSLISPINKLQLGEIVTVQGEVVAIRNVYTKRFKKIQEAKVKDDTGEIDILWFNQPFIVKTIQIGDKISLSGRIDKEGGKIKMIGPDYEIMYENKPTIHTGRRVPIYPETKGVSSKWLRRQIYKIIYENRELFDDHLPYSIIGRINLTGLKDAIEHIHFPNKLEETIKAKERLSFDELFLIQLSTLKKREEWNKQLHGIPFSIEKFQKEIDIFWEKLPFSPTAAQRKAIHEIFADLTHDKPMNRLLQGDVGSGKTIVATIAMYLAFLNGFQSVLMAPTEILAEQHYQTISKILEPLGITVGLRTGSKKSKDEYNILVGTHAVISESVQFDKLGFVVIDEQQRFGVEQRAIIKQKGNNPHLLSMTATPIPRTVALTLYGDLDLSVLDEMPKGRKKVKTWLVPNIKRENGYKWIEKQIKENGDQAFIICPFIEESETMTTVKAAAKEFERLQKDVFPHIKLGLLHGKMKPKEKEKELEQFRNKEFDILVATPVVEVGIDIPNATIILIEAAERFGLSQLHQLRGRVGRGDKQSYCLLFTESLNEQTRTRLSSLERIYNGAELAELDLKLRGSGDIYGTAQSGWKMLKIASFSDIPLIEKAKKAAGEIFNKLEQYPKLQKKIQEITTAQIAHD